FGGVVFLEPLRRFEGRLHKAVAATAADMMTPDPITVEADDSARKAARLIADRGHNRLPVLVGGRLVGVITRVDVLGALATGAELRIALDADADLGAWTRDLLDWIDRPSRVHVKLDSGMGRLGTTDPDEARELCRAVAASDDMELAGLMTHFATADDRDDDH